MVKLSGGVRTYGRGDKTYRKRLAEVGEMRASGKYSLVEMGKGGGWYAIEKSHAPHHPEEIEAAKILADKGYKVILKNEAGLGLKIKTPDGYIFRASFEQRTPKSDGAVGVERALKHAREKKADIALIYDKNKLYDRADVENGILKYEHYNKYRFKQIIVVSSNGNIHRHKHNDDST